MKSHYLLPLILISSLSYATPSALQNKDVVISPLSLQKEKRGDAEVYILTGVVKNISGYSLKNINIMINTYKDGKVADASSDTAFCVNKDEEWISKFYLQSNSKPDSYRVVTIETDVDQDDKDDLYPCRQSKIIPINKTH
ncbi:hypothetical protein OFY73_004144 [Salmonella enterica]|uniref:Uncharacterized protein n=1 Tax=Salmonella enterica I TaxID=59201 RepID=A0A3U2S036_SALET|nr:hypothetical protein [Salmonella enterica subsp. enterica serovar Hessarek]EBF7358735.1 hypothetical protein [Salmonella enterica subsp. enterica serovar Edinburgh]EBH8903956.1 hypothetical protein [Salmonella enterica subsp. enterica serovar 6,7:b:-]EBH8908115.1 hypothetical protein [Salmonella enterica subsp. enterica serovar Santiago]EDI7707506.1 hypothetical protein [Salmonella enterica]EDQ9755109.1 hypothetical protein [Salmonella enterica subsp. enterica]HCM1959192.1 hypothetical pro